MKSKKAFQFFLWMKKNGGIIQFFFLVGREKDGIIIFPPEKKLRGRSD
jgi:hypothetical protein